MGRFNRKVAIHWHFLLGVALLCLSTKHALFFIIEKNYGFMKLLINNSNVSFFIRTY